MTINMARRIFAALLAAFTLIITGCAEIERSASQAFDNANSAISHGDPVLWKKDGDTAAPESTPVPRARKY